MNDTMTATLIREHGGPEQLLLETVERPRPRTGEAPVAFVVLEPGVPASEDELRRHALDNGPAYAHPRRVFFLDALPLNATNKLDRGELQRRAAELLPDGLRPGSRPAAR